MYVFQHIGHDVLIWINLNTSFYILKMIVSLYMLLFIPGDKYADVKQFTDEDVEYIVQFVAGLLHEYENQLTEVKVRLCT